MRSASELKTFLAAQGIDLSFVQDTADAHTGTAIITSPTPTTPSSSCPAPMRWSAPPMSAQPRLQKATSPSASSKFRSPRSAAFFKRARAAGATTILNPAPAVAFGAELLDLVDILILNETELGLLAETELHDSDDVARFIDAARRCTATDKRSSASPWANAACWRWSTASR